MVETRKLHPFESIKPQVVAVHQEVVVDKDKLLASKIASLIDRKDKRQKAETRLDDSSEKPVDKPDDKKQAIDKNKHTQENKQLGVRRDEEKRQVVKQDETRPEIKEESVALKLARLVDRKEPDKTVEKLLDPTRLRNENKEVSGELEIDKSKSSLKSDDFRKKMSKSHVSEKKFVQNKNLLEGWNFTINYSEKLR